MGGYGDAVRAGLPLPDGYCKSCRTLMYDMVSDNEDVCWDCFDDWNGDGTGSHDEGDELAAAAAMPPPPPRPCVSRPRGDAPPRKVLATCSDLSAERGVKRTAETVDLTSQQAAVRPAKRTSNTVDLSCDDRSADMPPIEQPVESIDLTGDDPEPAAARTSAPFSPVDAHDGTNPTIEPSPIVAPATTTADQPLKQLSERDNVVLAGSAVTRIKHDKRSQYEAVLAAFQKPDNEAWIRKIPRDAILTLGDVHAARSGAAEIYVVEPQTYEQVTVLKRSHHMFSLGQTREEQQESHKLDYGYFYSDPHQTQAANSTDSFQKFEAGYQSNQCPKYNSAADNHFAVSGTGCDVWYKVTPSLIKHAEGA